MHTHDTLHASTPAEYRTSDPQPFSITEPHPAIERDHELIEVFLAGPYPPNLPIDWSDINPLQDIDPDAVREYQRHMDELRELRIQREHRELGLDYDVDL